MIASAPHRFPLDGGLAAASTASLAIDKPAYGAFSAKALDQGYDRLTVWVATAATSPDLYRDLIGQIPIKGGVLGADTHAVLDALPA
ncbi:hypothetical protein P7D22_19845 [Lichenihabitans sp. Uapishka_5]|uniref:hypothetical protein n=1 Tax=Lichenihabitans sp. Uapishka_5 TaxID=3037302 RepID=UPI0029E80055|nr:hypothetical protein [Lichenihabitans sp. Uapishka_5]MDX7953421.1 hypothetical protein [Lichenihabitans sp. Uapishka_5]